MESRKEAIKDLPKIPTFSGRTVSELTSSQDFLQAWETHQIIHLPRQYDQEQSAGVKEPFSWKEIQTLFRGVSSEDKESFCVETSSPPSSHQTLRNEATDDPSPDSYFYTQPATLKGPQSRYPYYCSFLVQKDKNALDTLVAQLPIARIQPNWHHEPCVWIFFGRNLKSDSKIDAEENDSSPSDLQGRPEHTDSISHDGTWHFQLSGTKRWLLRPTRKLMDSWKDNGQDDILERWKSSNNDKTQPLRLLVECQEGDIILVNTRLWFHQTILPPQDTPSVSYARDFWTSLKTDDAAASIRDDPTSNMTNIDGLYATEDIEAGVVIFREEDMPDCELHRSKDNPNCQVVELDDGTGAVVSCRPIAAGDFFCVAESSDDDDDSDDNGDDRSNDWSEEEGEEEE